MSAKFMVNLSLSLKIRISDISRISCAATVIILNLHGDKILTSSDMYNHILKLKLYAFNIPTQIKKQTQLIAKSSKALLYIIPQSKNVLLG